MKALLKRIGIGALVYLLLGEYAFVVLSLLGVDFDTIIGILGIIYVGIVSVIIYKSVS